MSQAPKVNNSKKAPITPRNKTPKVPPVDTTPKAPPVNLPKVPPVNIPKAPSEEPPIDTTTNINTTPTTSPDPKNPLTEQLLQQLIQQLTNNNQSTQSTNNSISQSQDQTTAQTIAPSIAPSIATTSLSIKTQKDENIPKITENTNNNIISNKSSHIPSTIKINSYQNSTITKEDTSNTIFLDFNNKMNKYKNSNQMRIHYFLNKPIKNVKYIYINSLYYDNSHVRITKDYTFQLKFTYKRFNITGDIVQSYYTYTIKKETFNLPLRKFLIALNTQIDFNLFYDYVNNNIFARDGDEYFNNKELRFFNLSFEYDNVFNKLNFKMNLVNDIDTTFTKFNYFWITINWMDYTNGYTFHNLKDINLYQESIFDDITQKSYLFEGQSQLFLNFNPNIHINSTILKLKSKYDLSLNNDSNIIGTINSSTIPNTHIIFSDDSNKCICDDNNNTIYELDIFLTNDNGEILTTMNKQVIFNVIFNIIYY